MNLTLLPRAVAAGAMIQADTKVDEILIENGRAVGVRGMARHPDTGEPVGPVEVRAPRVLPAGAGTLAAVHAGLGDQMKRSDEVCTSIRAQRSSDSATKRSPVARRHPRRLLSPPRPPRCTPSRILGAP